jgi:glycosyltransferase involved in cell wall biosynthesis
MATRNRSRYLRGAIASVFDQSHDRWELLIVDDGSEDATPELLEQIDEPRIRHWRTEHRGLSAARNTALAEARGDFVAYLDDDNRMHQHWLRSVVWALSEYRDFDALYGAILLDDTRVAHGLGRGGLPELGFPPYSREWLERENLQDIGAVAHRAHLPEAHFDESLDVLEDWDLLLRLTQKKDPLVLPAVALIYTTGAPGRLMDKPVADLDAATQRIRGKLLKTAR